MKFYASIRIDIRRVDAIKQGSDIVGNSCRIKVVKNKVAPPFKQCEIDIIYGKGISKSGSLLDFAVVNDIVVKSGSWFSYDGKRIGQGRENAKVFLEDNPEVAAEIEEKLRAVMLSSSANVPMSIEETENEED